MRAALLACLLLAIPAVGAQQVLIEDAAGDQVGAEAGTNQAVDLLRFTALDTTSDGWALDLGSTRYDSGNGNEHDRWYVVTWRVQDPHAVDGTPFYQGVRFHEYGYPFHASESHVLLNGSERPDVMDVARDVFLEVRHGAPGSIVWPGWYFDIGLLDQAGIKNGMVLDDFQAAAYIGAANGTPHLVDAAEGTATQVIRYPSKFLMQRQDGLRPDRDPDQESASYAAALWRNASERGARFVLELRGFGPGQTPCDLVFVEIWGSAGDEIRFDFVAEADALRPDGFWPQGHRDHEEVEVAYEPGKVGYVAIDGPFAGDDWSVDVACGGMRHFFMDNPEGLALPEVPIGLLVVGAVVAAAFMRRPPPL